MIKFTSVFLCLVIIFPVVPVFASESKFISYKVQSIDEYGEITESNEAAYFDGQNLYVAVNFFTDFTLYYYDVETTSFIRKGQEKTSKFGKVELDLLNKKAVVYANPISKREYKLDNVYKFGNQVFLPLAQMISFLKASLSIENDTVRIVNSGYSLVDAEYAMNKLCEKNSPINYGIDNVIDDIYGGSETAYYYSSVLGYFGSTIFGLRLSKLDFITNVGELEEYEDFIEKCVTNNDTYIELLTTNDDLINRFNLAYNLNKDINDLSKDMKDITSVVKDVAEPVKDSSLSTALLWVDARDWNALFESISTVANVADYYLKLGSMCEDHKNMIDAVESKSTVDENGLPLHLAIENVQKKFSQDLVNNIMTEIGQELVKKAIDKGKKVVLEKAIPSTAAIKLIAKAFKLMGFDIASDADYSIMIDLNAKHMLFNDYIYQDSSLTHKNSNQTEKYRLSAIFLLQACRQTYISANKLAGKHDLSKNYYKNQIENIENVLGLYYLAAQSKYFDNFIDIEKNIENSKKIINDSSFINNSVEISEEEANYIISGYNQSIVNKLSQGTWYSISELVYPGEWGEYTFDKKGNAKICMGDIDGDNQYNTTYTILNDQSLQFTLKHGVVANAEDWLVTVEIVENSNMVKASYKFKNGKGVFETFFTTAWSNEEPDVTNTGVFAKNIIGYWNSKYFSSEYPTYQLISIYDIDISPDSKTINGIVAVDHGEVRLYGYSITDRLVTFTWHDGWLLLEKTNNDNIINAMIFDDHDPDIKFEKWERLN